MGRVKRLSGGRSHSFSRLSGQSLLSYESSRPSSSRTLLTRALSGGTLVCYARALHSYTTLTPRLFVRCVVLHYSHSSSESKGNSEQLNIRASCLVDRKVYRDAIVTRK